MIRSREDLYLFRFTSEDEVTLVPGGCAKPWACSCTPKTPFCGMTPQEAHQKIIEYYRDKAEHYSKLSADQFMTELGFYTFQK